MCVLIVVFLGGCLIFNPLPNPKATVILFRGYGDVALSSGIDDLASELNADGFEIQVYPYTEWQTAVSNARPDGKLIVIGYSFGGYAAQHFVSNIGRDVDLVYLLEPTAPPITGPLNPDPITSNAKRVTEVYIKPQTPLTRYPGPRITWDGGVANEIVVGPEGDWPEGQDINHLTLDDNLWLRGEIKSTIALSLE